MYKVVNTIEPTNNICFHSEGSEVLRLDKDGFHYKGQTIDDAGEAHRLFIDWMKVAMESNDE